MADDGQGATLVFGTSATFTTNVKPRSMNVTGKAVRTLETHTLATTGSKTATKADLTEREKISVTIFYDHDNRPPVGVSQTMTLTYPIPSGLTNGATKAGTGIVVSESHTIQSGELMEGTFEIEFLAGTTDAAAS